MDRNETAVTKPIKRYDVELQFEHWSNSTFDDVVEKLLNLIPGEEMTVTRISPSRGRP